MFTTVITGTKIRAGHMAGMLQEHGNKKFLWQY